MPTPEESVIRRDVIGVLSRASGFPPEQITPTATLAEKLGLTVAQRRALATQFEEIAQRTNASARVTKAECEKLKTVQGAGTFVLKKATP